MKITDFDIGIEIEKVLALANCYPDSPVYEAVMKDLEEILPEAYQKLQPAAVVKYAEITDAMWEGEPLESREVVFCIESVGEAMSVWAAEFFEQGNYVKGMLADAIADVCLFQMDASVGKTVAKLCKAKNYGVVKRLEAPRDVPLDVQKIAWEVTDAEKEIGLKIKESFMLDPVKSNCQIYVVAEGCTEDCVAHDCRRCPAVNCPMRSEASLVITIRKGEKEWKVDGKKGQTLLEVFQEAGVHIDAACGGRGTCGKCKVRFLEGSPKLVKEERGFFSKEELEAGWHLACKVILERGCVVELQEAGEEEHVVVAEYEGKEKHIPLCREERYGIAVDIGTTTIVMQLVELSTGTVIDTYTSVNRQRNYGADVISRIQASNEGKANILRKSILSDLERGLAAFTKNEKCVVEKMSISGNTTMIHLLMGYSCEGLGAYPFEPVNLCSIETDYRELFENETYHFPIHVIPGISAYVGGDITAGLLSCGFDTCEKVSMLIDLGTNGEMAIGNKDKILAASAAAGPAFEGGNIFCGIGSVPGAISEAVYRDGRFEVKTIGERQPIGICGTGVVEIISELRRRHLIDETGLLAENYAESGVPIVETPERKILLCQKDIREIQLAKAAIRGGMETLLHVYGISCRDVDRIYIAGGFGYALSVEKAVGIGLLPKEYQEKVRTVGNSALRGSVLDLMDSDAKNREQTIVDLAEEVQLAMIPEFNDYYMKYMYF